MIHSDEKGVTDCPTCLAYEAFEQWLRERYPDGEYDLFEAIDEWANLPAPKVG